MRTSYRIPDTDIQFEVDSDLLTITVTKGEFASKDEFLTLIHSRYILILVNQFLIGDSGCVDPNAYDILQAIESGDAALAYNIADEWYHEFDHYQILVRLK
jgi:hypothetical protein